MLICTHFTRGRVRTTHWKPFEVVRVDSSSFVVEFQGEPADIQIEDHGTVWQRAH